MNNFLETGDTLSHLYLVFFEGNTQCCSFCAVVTLPSAQTSHCHNALQCDAAERHTIQQFGIVLLCFRCTLLSLSLLDKK